MTITVTDLNEWHRVERLRIHAIYDEAHQQLQSRRREELRRLELGVQQVARDIAAAAAQRQADDGDN